MTCPECQGPLWKIKEDPLPRYRCHLGHAYTAQTLSASQAEVVEQALWVALRVLEERAKLLEGIADSQKNSRPRAGLPSQRYESEAGEMKKHAGVIRELLEKGYSSR